MASIADEIARVLGPGFIDPLLKAFHDANGGSDYPSIESFYRTAEPTFDTLADRMLAYWSGEADFGGVSSFPSNSLLLSADGLCLGGDQLVLGTTTVGADDVTFGTVSVTFGGASVTWTGDSQWLFGGDAVVFGTDPVRFE